MQLAYHSYWQTSKFSSRTFRLLQEECSAFVTVQMTAHYGCLSRPSPFPVTLFAADEVQVVRTCTSLR
jgi:hypothetical protein